MTLFSFIRSTILHNLASDSLSRLLMAQHINRRLCYRETRR